MKTAQKPCPICEKPASETYHPFCSKRCADVDLQRWFTGTYAVPSQEESSDVSSDGGLEEDDRR